MKNNINFSQKFREAKRKIKRKKRLRKKERIKNLGENTKHSFKQIKEIKEEFKPYVQIMKEENGTLIIERNDIVKQFREVYRA